MQTIEAAELGIDTAAEAEAPTRTEVVPAGCVGVGDAELVVGDAELVVGDAELVVGDAELVVGDAELVALELDEELVDGPGVGTEAMVAVVAVNASPAAVRRAAAPRTSAAATPAMISPYSMAEAPRSRRGLTRGPCLAPPGALRAPCLSSRSRRRRVSRADRDRCQCIGQ